MIARVVAPLMLLTAVALTVLGFVARRLPGSGSPASPSDAVAAAHTAAGVRTVAAGDLAASFTQRVRALEDHLESAPDNRAVHLELARLLHDGHRTREAIPHYVRAVALDPDEPQAYFDLAAAHGELGEWDRAGSVLEERLARAPDDAVAMYDLGAVLANRGDARGAREWWARARVATDDDGLREQIDAASDRLGARLP